MKRFLAMLLILMLLPCALADDATDEAYDRMTALNALLIEAEYFTGDYFAYVDDSYENGVLSFFPEDRTMSIAMFPDDEGEHVNNAVLFCYDTDMFYLMLNCACGLALYDGDVDGAGELADWLDDRADLALAAAEEGEYYAAIFDDADEFFVELINASEEQGGYLMVAIYFYAPDADEDEEDEDEEESEEDA